VISALCTTDDLRCTRAIKWLIEERHRRQHCWDSRKCAVVWLHTCAL